MNQNTSGSKYFIFDIETSGFSPRYHSIISLSGVLVDKNFNEKATFNEFVKPYTFKTWSDEAEQIHKISRSRAEKFQSQGEFLRKLITFLGKEQAVAIVHAAYRKNFYKLFDYEFLCNLALLHNRFHELIYGKIPRCRSTILSPSDFNFAKKPHTQKLNDWATFLGIEFSHHTSLDDAQVTVEVAKYQAENWNRSFNG